MESALQRFHHPNVRSEQRHRWEAIYSLSSSASASVSSYSDVDSDDTIILQRSPASTTKEEDSRLAKDKSIKAC
ncbi:hypothetical protein NQZ68_015156 [Dissostichus eleginoides]|nr:hypothetical protein NQZ68_015156 [Dissostichus eleginoides]